MNQDARVGQGETLALRSAHEKKSSHARRLTDAIGHHVVLDELHRVIDRQPGGNRTPGELM